jgi:hypothetical protein
MPAITITQSSSGKVKPAWGCFFIAGTVRLWPTGHKPAIVWMEQVAKDNFTPYSSIRIFARWHRKKPCTVAGLQDNAVRLYGDWRFNRGMRVVTFNLKIVEGVVED